MFMFNSLPPRYEGCSTCCACGKFAVTTAKCHDKHFKKKKTQPVYEPLEIDELLQIQAIKNKFMEEYIHLIKQEMESRKKFQDECRQLMNDRNHA